MTRRTYTLTKAQCDNIKEQDHVYMLNAISLLKNAVQWSWRDKTGTTRYPSWINDTLIRLGDEAIKRWEKANPIPKTVIAVAFDKAQRTERRAA